MHNLAEKLKFDPRKDTRRLITIVIASVIMALNINSFVHSGNLVPGGATGLTLLLQRIFRMFLGISLPYTLINVILNAIPVYIGFRFIGIKFTLYSVLMILCSSAMVDILPGYTITSDPLLTSVFGGMINGFVIALCLSADMTTGGTDFIGIFLSQKKGVDSFNMILGFNAVILAISGFLFGWPDALYSIIFQFVSTQALHALYRNYQQQTLFIVTNHAKEVCDEIYRVSHHGATIMVGMGSYKENERDVVYSVVSGTEAKGVIRAVKETDPAAFINSFRSTEIKGRFFQKPKD